MIENKIELTVTYPAYDKMVTSHVQIDVGDLYSDALRNGWREYVTDTSAIEAKIAERDAMPDGSVERSLATAEILQLSKNPVTVVNPVSPGEHLTQIVLKFITELLVDDKQLNEDMEVAVEQLKAQYLQNASARIAVNRS